MNPFKRHIRWKLLSVLFLLIVGISLLLTIQHVYTQKKMLETVFLEQKQLLKENLLIRAKSHTEALAAQLENELAAFNFSGMIELANTSASKIDEIDFIMIVENGGNVVVHTADPNMVQSKVSFNPPAGTQLDVTETDPGEHPALQIRRALHMGNSAWGALVVAFTQSQLEAKVERYALLMQQKVRDAVIGSFVSMILFILIGFPLVYDMAGRMSDPIRKLTRRAEHLAAGKFDTCCDLAQTRSDEIGVLSATFDKMSHSLHQSYQKLEEYNTELEQKVAERTLELEQTNAVLQRLSVTDHLTQLYNRAKLENVFDEQIQLCERYGKHFSVLLCDVDHFKNVNDTYGHQTGDRVLKTCANLLRESIRQTDIIGRWGGEEFLILCPETDKERAMLLAEKLRTLLKTKLATVFEDDYRQTISIGVSSYMTKDTHERMLKRADTALYRAKSRGRDRVCFTTDPT